MQTNLKKKLLDCATAPYRLTGSFNYRWARGKLNHDPIFTALIEQSVFPDAARVLDLGCGRGLLAAWFLAAEQLVSQGDWSATVMPPKNLHFRGVELMTREAECGNLALQPIFGKRVQLIGGDMREADMHDTDVIAILDVLHYIPYAEQNLMLDRLRAALDTGGIFVTRVGDAGSGLRFAISQIVDFGISFAQGHRLMRMWCRPLADWVDALESRGFVVQAIPMSVGTPFSNVMLISQVVSGNSKLTPHFP
jgi:SAM-dependent methyltransferase